ncbi:MAG TPA: helix-turn-helix domain-containing protein [Shinella sp.]|jgi:AraC-like DNA-binding protein|uniref:helix-turn-helix domain-containing protein n=1 Tax=Shinella sp. TaxID=1870904 RepID=UPI0029B23773|nr:helix-turn-helix domain-containing protein [Shinella sp.]MDX3974213.1 helix-turn-helix domain-containing protein [Shinella sp.]HEV7246991.1 helix-turn-helix domain-containing protein [Shinella sp.]
MSSAAKLPSNSVLAEAGEDCRRKSQLFAETLDPVFGTTMATPEKISDFRAGLSTYFMGPAVFFVADLRGTTYTFSRDSERIARSGLDLIFVQKTLEGSDVRTLNGETVLVEAGDISIFDLSRPMHSETQHCRNLTLVLPRHLLFSKDVQNDALHGLLLKRSTSTARLIGSHLRALFEDLADINQAEAPAIVTATANLVTNLVGPQVADRSLPSPTVRGAMIMQIRRYIEQHIALPDLGPDHLCKMFGLSRASLYRLFEPIGGVTDYIRTRRLRAAFDMLANEHQRTVGEIAYACGFADISAFSRAFRHQFGMSPSEVRDMGGSRPLARGSAEKQAATSVHDWLRIVSAL